MLTRLNNNDFNMVYQIMEDSFPIDERRPYNKQKDLLLNDIYRIYVVLDEDNNQIKAFAAIYELDSFTFLEHFAVSSMYRNQGLGGQILHELMKLYCKPVCLEVEPPDTDIAIRRIAFYKRNGFCFNDYPYVQPALAESQNPIPLKLMYSGKLLSQVEFKQVRDKIYKDVYKCSDFCDKI